MLCPTTRLVRSLHPYEHYTSCLRFRKTHSAVTTARNRPSTGQVFHRGIGGSVSSGTFSGRGSSSSSREVDSGLKNFPPVASAERVSSGSFIAIRSISPAGGSTRNVVVGIGPSSTGGGSSRTVYSPSASCGSAPSKRL